MPPQQQATAEIHQEPYTIHKYPNPEPIPIEQHPKLLRNSSFVSFGFWILYNAIQVRLAWSVQVDEPSFSWRMWGALAAEFLLSFQARVLELSYIFCLASAKTFETRPCYFIEGDRVPTVDVFITCCGEPINVILDTVAAAVGQDYPCSRFRVFVLDDGRDRRLREAVETRFGDDKRQQENAPSPLVLYLCRKDRNDIRPEIMAQPKSGNNQFGLDETERLGGSEYFASVDADMIPEADWLRRVIPHLVLDDRIGLACPPQVWSRHDGRWRSLINECY